MKNGALREDTVRSCSFSPHTSLSSRSLYPLPTFEQDPHHLSRPIRNIDERNDTILIPIRVLPSHIHRGGDTTDTVARVSGEAKDAHTITIPLTWIRLNTNRTKRRDSIEMLAKQWQQTTPTYSLGRRRQREERSRSGEGEARRRYCKKLEEGIKLDAELARYVL